MGRLPKRLVKSRCRVAIGAALQVASNVIKALIVWAVTNAIQDFFRTRAKSNALPMWLIFAALFVRPLFVYLALFVVVSTVASVFYRVLWGQYENSYTREQ